MIKTGQELVNGIPRLISVFAYRLSRLGKKMFTDFKKDKTGSFVFERYRFEDFAEFLLDELKVREKRYLLENAYFIIGLDNQKELCLFEFEEWIINISELNNGKEPRSTIYLKSKYNIPCEVSRISLALMMTENLGDTGRWITGTDFSSRTWIRYLSKETPLLELFVKYMKASFKYPNYSIFLDGIKNNYPLGHSDMENESLIVMRFVIKNVMDLLINIPEFDDNLELFFEMKIAGNNQDKDKEVYWVELGKYYFIFNKGNVDGFEIGLIEELKYVADYRETYSQYLWDIGFRGINLLEPEIQHITYRINFVTKDINKH